MASELNALLDELSARLEKLKMDYERYFLGLEKLEPAQDRKEISQIIRQLKTMPTANTALKFRLQSLNQRFLSYQNYWNRILRQIEAGTYKRDLARVERDLKRKGVDVNLTSKRSRGELEAAIMEQLSRVESSGRGDEGALGAPADVPSGEGGVEGGVSQGPMKIPGLMPPPIPSAAAGTASPPAPPPGAARGAGPSPPPIPSRSAAGPPPPPPAAAGDAQDRMKRLYRAYIAAKHRVGEPTEGITFERLVSTLQKQIPVIQQKTGCRQVDFKIEIKDGKAILKAVPKQ